MMLGKVTRSASKKMPPRKYWNAAARRMAPCDTPVPMPRAIPLRMSCCKGSLSSAWKRSTD